MPAPVRPGVAAILACLSLTTVLASRVLQQDQSPPQVPRFRSGVELVVLDVSVLDPDRMPVRGLTAGDFTIVEDGQPQKLQSFTAIDLPDVVREGPAPWLRKVPSDVRSNQEATDRRIVVIVLDDWSPIEADEVPWVTRVAERVVEQLGPADLATVVFTWAKNRGQEFTHDQERLLAAVHRFNGAIPGMVPATSADSAHSASLAGYDATLRTLGEICDGLADLPNRRKTLFFISPGLPLDFAEGMKPALYTAGEPTGDSFGAYSQLLGTVGGFLRSANRANVNVYGIDPGGLRAPKAKNTGLMGGTSFGTNLNKVGIDFLKSISVETGGTATVDTNDFASGVTQAFRENSSYYLLGYASSNPRTSGRFRKVEVRVNRPGVTVRTRNGYFEATPPPKTADTGRRAAPPDIEKAIAGMVPKTDLSMQVTAAPFAVPGRSDAAVALVLGVHQNAPTRATRVGVNVDLRAAAFGPDGKQKAARREQVPVMLNTPSMRGTIGYEIFVRLNLQPGRYYLRVAAECSFRGIQLSPRAPAVALVELGEDTGPRSGSVYCDLEVPDFERAPFSLSGIVLGVDPAVASGPRDRFASLMPIAPTTMRQFTRDDRVRGFLRIYQRAAKSPVPAQLSTRVFDANDSVVFEENTALETAAFAKARTADYLVDLPTERLKAGMYLLRVEARAGDKSGRREVRFEIR